MSHWCCQFACSRLQDNPGLSWQVGQKSKAPLGAPQVPEATGADHGTYACVCQRQNTLPLPLCAKQHALILTMVPMVPMIMSHWLDLVCLHGGSTFTKQAILFGRPTSDQKNNEAKTDFLWKLCTKSWQYVPQRMSSTRLGYPWVLAINCQAQNMQSKS